MIDKILRSIGLVRVSTLREEDWFEQYYESKFDGEKMESMRSLLAKIPEFKEYCDWTVAQDIKRYYEAQPQEQQMIRGAVGRTRFLKRMATQESDGKQLEKLPIGRYK